MLGAEAVLISVPHTGTQFVINLMKNARPRFKPNGLMGEPNKHHTLFHGHCIKDGQTDRAILLAKRMPLIMPMRHPYRVEASWLVRLDWHNGRPPEREDIIDLWSAYDNFLNKLLPLVSCFIPVDGTPSQQGSAHYQLARRTNADFVIRWGKRKNDLSGIGNRDLSLLEPSTRIREVRSHTVFSEFYGSMDEEDDLIDTKLMGVMA